MALSKEQFSSYIKAFLFRELFNEMGWNNDKTIQHITIDNATCTVKAVAEKSSFKILVCEPNGLCKGGGELSRLLKNQSSGKKDIYL